MIRAVVQVGVWDEWPENVFPIISVTHPCPEPYSAGSISFGLKAPMWRDARRAFTRMEDMKLFTDGDLIHAGLFKIGKGGEVYVE